MCQLTVLTPPRHSVPLPAPDDGFYGTPYIYCAKRYKASHSAPHTKTVTLTVAREEVGRRPRTGSILSNNTLNRCPSDGGGHQQPGIKCLILSEATGNHESNL